MLTINSWLQGASRLHRPVDECPLWPPDMFAICGSLLKRSGAYLLMFDGADRGSEWIEARGIGSQWRASIDRIKKVSVSRLRRSVPSEVKDVWSRVTAEGDTEISAIASSPGISDNLLRLSLIADEASSGIGVNTDDSTFFNIAQAFLEGNKLTSFTWDIPKSAVSVLGKQHTPQRGATLRSLTHHLALYWPHDIEGRWVGPYGRGINDKAFDTVNLLLLPWPEQVGTDDFRLVGRRHAMSDNAVRFFNYEPSKKRRLPRFIEALSATIRAARQHAEHIDAIVFPELALSRDEYFAAERLAIDSGTMLIAGARLPGSYGRKANFCVVQPAGLLYSPSGPRPQRRQFIESLRLVQSKHHRWCLDEDQIIQYQLGGRMPLATVWENIEISPRVLHFLTLGHWMTWSVLICEDLARQDPAADMIRAVGPNLLIALLMDGPQLRGRWASRYASVLSEDPGTSVLTLTSLGMAERCRPMLSATQQRAQPSRAIALWRDSVNGEREIVLDAGDNACVLSLVCRQREEVAADGCGDNDQAYFPVYAGFKSFRAQL